MSAAAEKTELDILWVEGEKSVRAIINSEIVSSILLPNAQRSYFLISDLFEFRARDKFRRHPSLDEAKKAVIAVYLGLEEKPDDIIVTGQVKAWNGKEWLLSDEEYQKAKADLMPWGACVSRLGACVSHGADIAGRTEAAIYLTSSNMSAAGYVFRLDIIKDEVSKVEIEMAPAGLAISR